MNRNALVALIALAFLGVASAGGRIKDITGLPSAPATPVVGYGLVTGLSGTGDSLRNAPFTEQALQSMLDQLGVNVRGAALRTRNVAAVIVTADIPAFVARGSRVDVGVSALGDATSLNGGTLVMTPLASRSGAGRVIAQGPVTVSAFSAAGQAETVTQGVPTSGRIPNGGLVEDIAPSLLARSANLSLELRNADYATARRVAEAINAFTQSRYRADGARAIDSRSIALRVPPKLEVQQFLAEIGELPVEVSMPARVVIDERTGTIVIGQDVRVSTVAVTHGSVTVRITETPVVSQPLPRSNGVTAVQPQTQIDAIEQGGQMQVLAGADLRTLVKGLNQIGLKPAGIVAILQAIKTAGALQAELIVQ